MKVVELGLTAYDEAERIQLLRLAEVQAGAEETLFLVEHPPVITLGRQGGLEHLRVSEARLAEQGVTLARSGRGGSITCHYPGQLVAYPIFRVERRPGGLKGFFHDLEETVIRALAAFGLPADRVDGRPGVWTPQGKICSIGIGVKRFVTFHGLSLNVSADLGPFPLITLCGLSDARPTSMALELGRDVPLREVRDVLVQQFRQVFPAA